MKAILGTVLVVVLSLGGFASPIIFGDKDIKSPENNFSVELLSVSPEFNAGEKGTFEMSSAFLAKQNSSSEEYFGSVWAEFEINEGSTSGMYEIKNWKVNDIRLAEDLPEEEKAQIETAFYSELTARFSEIPKSAILGLHTSTNIYDEEGFNTEVPSVLYSNQPSALIVIDGEPYYEELDKRYSKVANTGAFIVKDNKKDMHYMYGGGLWFSSGNALQGWEYNDKAPNRINRVMKKHARDLYDNKQEQQFQIRIVPDIIVSTEPAELISTDGSPKYVLIQKTKLAYVENSDAELFRDVNTHKYYSLFSGRWFVAERLEGSWQHVAPGDLPADFAQIPEDHEKANVLVSVPGTKAAKNAVRDAQVPNITKNDISKALNTKVAYNGDPEFAKIHGTGLSYAVNTSSPVLLWRSRYYLVEDAVWYHSSNPYGPWQIATQRPDGVEDIPADNPLYNIKYVYIYKNTDNVVYSGYTSGYTGSYVHGPTVVFGTGFHYHGWHGRFYYHHPMTYGYGFFYDPFYGWVPVYSPWFRSSFYWNWHMSWGWGWNWHWHGYRPPYYRPPHHRPKPEHPIERPGRPATRPEQPVARPDRPTTRPSQPNVRPTQPSARPSQPSVRPTPPAARPSQPIMRPSQPSTRPMQPAARPAPGPAPAQMRR
ncbi:hypothetical protein SLH46_07665 [Draconibacterium sp. IB214405]|uniref:hypothetical protein n=1 Tax=Draconibacterium sp. IB214405 TaxID=3097352 RepID=UPI002A0BCD30|nr:hypothetical protein [Draconibacterium sp. IB214405]MDX8339056.1 hypothetical protein [Draconibacterium sp. IB214405]